MGAVKQHFHEAISEPVADPTRQDYIRALADTIAVAKTLRDYTAAWYEWNTAKLADPDWRPWKIYPGDDRWKEKRP